ncbi:hypothetical protein FHG87_011413 [Trinorchestia longiramus]|nr:hypothetical protein FHG87_011413 [Trinorchestia longiramus]
MDEETTLGSPRWAHRTRDRVQATTPVRSSDRLKPLSPTRHHRSTDELRHAHDDTQSKQHLEKIDSQVTSLHSHVNVLAKEVRSAVQILQTLGMRGSSKSQLLHCEAGANDSIAIDVSCQLAPFTRSSPSVFVTTEEPLSPPQPQTKVCRHVGTQTHLPINVPVAVLEAFVLAHKDRVLHLLGVEDQSSPASPAYTKLEGSESKTETDQDSFDTRESEWNTSTPNADCTGCHHSRDSKITEHHVSLKSNSNDLPKENCSGSTMEENHNSCNEMCSSSEPHQCQRACHSPSSEKSTEVGERREHPYERRRFNVKCRSSRSESSPSPSSSVSSTTTPSNRRKSSLLSGLDGSRDDDHNPSYPEHNSILVQQDHRETDVITFPNPEDNHKSALPNCDSSAENNSLLNTVAYDNPRIVSRTRSGVLPGTYQLTNLQDWGPNCSENARQNISNSISMGSIKEFIHRCGPFMSNTKITRNSSSELGCKSARTGVKRPDYIPLDVTHVRHCDAMCTTINMPRSTSMPAAGVCIACRKKPMSKIEYPLDQCLSKWSVPPPGDVEEMQGGSRRVHLEWEAFITL